MVEQDVSLSFAQPNSLFWVFLVCSRYKSECRLLHLEGESEFEDSNFIWQQY